ncbi:hypothetical protein TNCV_2985061 [Trichonephila clavipes]|nr:hypothetical protein TNCV_2985061 [Trichonephila clavipes]
MMFTLHIGVSDCSMGIMGYNIPITSPIPFPPSCIWPTEHSGVVGDDDVSSAPRCNSGCGHTQQCTWRYTICVVIVIATHVSR